MSTDTRPSVTVIGDLLLQKTALASYAFVAIDNLPDIGLKDGDEVEVTIRKHERLPANPWSAPRAQETLLAEHEAWATGEVSEISTEAMLAGSPKARAVAQEGD